MYSLGLLPGGLDMVRSVREAQRIIKAYEEDHDIIEIRSLLTLHTTLNYFCCHTPEVTVTVCAVRVLYTLQYE